MYVYVYSIDIDGQMYRQYRAKPPEKLDHRAACVYAAMDYVRGYLEDYGCDFEDMLLNVNRRSVELTLKDWDGEDGRMYFTTEVPTS